MLAVLLCCVLVGQEQQVSWAKTPEALDKLLRGGCWESVIYDQQGNHLRDIAISFETRKNEGKKIPYFCISLRATFLGIQTTGITWVGQYKVVADKNEPSGCVIECDLNTKLLVGSQSKKDEGFNPVKLTLRLRAIHELRDKDKIYVCFTSDDVGRLDCWKEKILVMLARNPAD